MGALGKEAKLFQATMPNQMININDKKLETMNGSFNLTMNVVPITNNPAEEVKPAATHQQIVKEEHEEEEEDEKVKKTQKQKVIPPSSAHCQSLNDTAASSHINLDQSQKLA
jgi:hypothetical protein